jgi:hypothetical protein
VTLQAPQTKYAKSGDLHIAYQVVGDGPIDLVLLSDWWFGGRRRCGRRRERRRLSYQAVPVVLALEECEHDVQ